MKVSNINWSKALVIPPAASDKNRPESKPKMDSVEISSASSEMQRPHRGQAAKGTGGAGANTYNSKPQAMTKEIDSGSSQQSDLSPIRPDKVERAKKLLEEGGYNRPEVIETIIDRLITAIREA